MFDSLPGLKRQVPGVSFKSLSSGLTSSSPAHPWYSRNNCWLSSGVVEAAIIQSECSEDCVKSIKLFCDIGQTGLCNDERFSASLESLIRRVTGGPGDFKPPLDREAGTVLADVWHQSKVGNLRLSVTTSALILDRCEDLFIEELEQAVVDCLPLEEGCHQPLHILRAISSSSSLFVKFMKTFATLLRETRNQPDLMRIFENFSETILNSRDNPITLYPATQQGLVALLILYRDLMKTDHSSLRREEIKAEIRSYDLSDFDTWLICAQFEALNIFD